jgi:hypothetical protein
MPFIAPTQRLSTMNTSTFHTPAPTLVPAPTGVGDWLDSSFELQRGVLVQELSALWWDRCLAAAQASNPDPQTTH